MTESDLTLKVLVEMRDEMRGLRTDFNERLTTLEHQAAESNRHTAETNQRLEVIEHTLVDFGTQVVILGRCTRVEKLETKR